MFAGYRLGLIVAGVLAAILAAWYLTTTLVNTGRQEEQLDNLKDQLELRNEIDTSIRNAPSDVQSAIELLQRRQNP